MLKKKKQRKPVKLTEYCINYTVMYTNKEDANFFTFVFAKDEKTAHKNLLEDIELMEIMGEPVIGIKITSTQKICDVTI